MLLILFGDIYLKIAELRQSSLPQKGVNRL